MQHLTEQWIQKSANDSQAYVKQMSRMVGQNSDLKYPGMLGLLAEYGKVYTPATASDPSIENGDMGECFANAARIAMIRSDYLYVEGYAIGAYIPMHHGWLTKDKRTAIDPTWSDGTDYFGIAFTGSFLRKRMQQTGYFGVMALDFPDAEMIKWFNDGFPPGALA